MCFDRTNVMDIDLIELNLVTSLSFRDLRAALELSVSQEASTLPKASNGQRVSAYKII